MPYEYCCSTGSLSKGNGSSSRSTRHDAFVAQVCLIGQVYTCHRYLVYSDRRRTAVVLVARQSLFVLSAIRCAVVRIASYF